MIPALNARRNERFQIVRYCIRKKKPIIAPNGSEKPERNE